MPFGSSSTGDITFMGTPLGNYTSPMPFGGLSSADFTKGEIEAFYRKWSPMPFGGLSSADIPTMVEREILGLDVTNAFRRFVLSGPQRGKRIDELVKESPMPFGGLSSADFNPMQISQTFSFGVTNAFRRFVLSGQLVTAN